MVESPEEWRKTETRWGYLSEKKEVQEDVSAPSTTASANDDTATPFSDADLAIDDSPFPSSSSSSPAAPTTTAPPPPFVESKLDAPVTANLVAHTAYLRSLASALELQSSNQAKKTAKAEAAKLREGKRKMHEVAKPSQKREKVWMGWKGAKNGPKVFKASRVMGGPMAKLSSARRRVYRRAAGA